MQLPTKALIPIPQNMTVTGSKCVQFSLPDDPEWLAMFWGALYQLTAWNSYDRDGVQSGAYCAEVWKSIIGEARTSECATDMILFQSSPCELSVSTDGGVTWTVVYNGMLCIEEALNEGIIPAGSGSPWSFTYDFTAGTQGATANVGHYASGQGFVSDLWHPNANYYTMADVSVTWPNTGHLTSITIEFLFEVGANECGTFQAGDFIGLGLDFNGSVAYATYCPAHSSPWTQAWDGNFNRTNVRLYPGFGVSSDPGGSATLQKIHLSGTGTNPFL